MSTPSVHHVWYCIPAWGHQSGCQAYIAWSLLENPNLKVSYIYHSFVAQKVEHEFSSLPAEARARLELKPYDPKLPHEQFFQGITQMAEHCVQYVMQLAADGTPPTKVVMDVSMGSDSYGKRMKEDPELSDKGVQVWGFWTGSVCSWYEYIVPRPDGIADYKEIVEALSEGKTLTEDERLDLVNDVMTCKNGKRELDDTVVWVPSVGKMYNYERDAGFMEIPHAPKNQAMTTSFVEFAAFADGMIVPGSEVLEKEAVEACSKVSRTVAPGLTVGPSVYDGRKLEDGELKTFLDAQGEKEVLLVSFGSHFFPDKYVDTFINILIDLQKPFVLADGRFPPEPLDDSLAAKIKAAPFAYYQLGWFDQLATLAHPAVGWFFCHAGWNGLCEALVSSVPVICWPLVQCDQGMNAALVSTRSKPLGFELMQIRQGVSRQKPYRGGGPIRGSVEDVEAEMRDVFEQAFHGGKGKEIRRNVEEVARQLREERDTRGKQVYKEWGSV